MINMADRKLLISIVWQLVCLLVDAVEVRQTVGKGLGAFATTPIAADELVCCYEDEKITLAEAKKRYPGGSKTADYLFKLGHEVYIDGAQSGHFSRCINHDELGNLGITLEEGQLAMRALRQIQAGEELLFDYRDRLLGRAHAESTSRI